MALAGSSDVRAGPGSQGEAELWAPGDGDVIIPRPGYAGLAVVKAGYAYAGGFPHHHHHHQCILSVFPSPGLKPPAAWSAPGGLPSALLAVERETSVGPHLEALIWALDRG